jgi:pimeloyl-ACP methyl ester carboxylesterase
MDTLNFLWLLTIPSFLISLLLAIAVFYILAPVANHIATLMAISAAVFILSDYILNIWFVGKTLNPYWVTGIWFFVLALGMILVFPSRTYIKQTPSAMPGMKYWNLSTGSRIAYTKIPSKGNAKETPIVFLHGGPGWLIMDSDTNFYGQLAENGYDVYLYDLIGSGRSARLEDKSQYNTYRHVADLEAIRQELGVNQMILIGQSWGNTLAVDYMAVYPNHVAKVIFSSPGAMWDVKRFKFDYSKTADLKEKGSKFTPRIIVAILMVTRNPLIAHQIVSEDNLAGFLDSMPTSVKIEQNYCAGAENKIPTAPIVGSNQYVNRLVFASQEKYPDPRPALSHNKTPALIMRGSCDFVPMDVAKEYKSTLPNSILVSIPDAGHALYSAQPDLVLSTLQSFLEQ